MRIPGAIGTIEFLRGNGFFTTKLYLRQTQSNTKATNELIINMSRKG